eukprot:1366270-Rhodomonas_salina.4
MPQQSRVMIKRSGDETVLQVPELGTAQNEFLFINSKMSKLKLSQYQRTGYHTPVIYFDLSPPDLGT